MSAQFGPNVSRALSRRRPMAVYRKPLGAHWLALLVSAAFCLAMVGYFGGAQ